MTSKLKCPFCGKKLWYDEQDGIYRCMKFGCVMDYEGGTEQLWQALIQAKQDLEIANEKIEVLEHNYSVKSEQHERGYAFATKTIKGLESKLEIARKAINQVMSMGANNNICYHLKAKTVKGILGKALEQIEHKE